VPGRSLTIEQILTILAETPPRIAALSAGLAPAQLHTSPNPDEWSANKERSNGYNFENKYLATIWGLY